MGAINRNNNYKILRAVGYSVQEAHRFKDRKRDFIDNLVESKRISVGDHAYININKDTKLSVIVSNLDGKNATVYIVNNPKNIMLISVDELSKELEK